MKFLLLLCGATVLLSGCCGPSYCDHQHNVWGVPAPTLTGAADPAIAGLVSPHPNTPVGFVGQITGWITTPLLKCNGIQGWKDFNLTAVARGVVERHAFSTDRFLTVDLRLLSLSVGDISIPLSGPRFIRLEIYQGQVKFDRAQLEATDVMLAAEGKLVWDTDGWFEIHPQKPGDVRVMH